MKRISKRKQGKFKVVHSQKEFDRWTRVKKNYVAVVCYYKRQFKAIWQSTAIIRCQLKSEFQPISK